MIKDRIDQAEVVIYYTLRGKRLSKNEWALGDLILNNMLKHKGIFIWHAYMRKRFVKQFNLNGSGSAGCDFDSVFKIIVFCLLFSIAAEAALASQQSQTISEPAQLEPANTSTIEHNPALETVNGLITLDYEVIPVPQDRSIDLLGFHYLQGLNDWLYLGIGAHAPLVYGDYGGFMAFDATIYAQRKIFGDSFIDAGASLGGGGGGSSVDQSRELSGKGGYFKGYVGVGYDFGAFSVGVNYAHFEFTDSSIDHSQFNFFIQKPVSFLIGSYADSGKKTAADPVFSGTGENILTLEFNNILQLEPKGSNKEDINTVSLQLTHFFNRSHYLFLGADVGYYGIPLYNQVLGGIGHRYSFSPRVNFYGQVGFGSGGFAEDVIETGSGLLVYPKLSVEYLLNNNIGLAFSGGYLFAPKGSSKNLTIGASLNYHLSAGEKRYRESGTTEGTVFRGFRFNLFQQTEFDVRFGNHKLSDINMLSAQLDKILSDNWYIPFQGSVAYNEFLGYPGYGEILAGLGVQSKFAATKRFQYFFQVLLGANVHSLVVKPTIGINYSLDDHFALYAQGGKAISFCKIDVFDEEYNEHNQRLNANFIGIGLTYRFSLPDTP